MQCKVTSGNSVNEMLLTGFAQFYFRLLVRKFLWDEKPNGNQL